jgi:hypothetical protein
MSIAFIGHDAAGTYAMRNAQFAQNFDEHVAQVVTCVRARRILEGNQLASHLEPAVDED